ncbi:unnamed protein product [Thelazia callipaeda]|uniref:Kazal-like domain-containing protein n=1 Tax=Thelazia callipaeda TaxID=103827 RepID=A0A0N5CSQ9_THECL|nr:unnamed protein product [Thelazia callipaeda]
MADFAEIDDAKEKILRIIGSSFKFTFTSSNKLPAYYNNSIVMRDSEQTKRNKTLTLIRSESVVKRQIFRRSIKKVTQLTETNFTGSILNSDLAACKNVTTLCSNESKSRIPICDNTNQTHASACSLALFNCRQIHLHNARLRVLVHVGACHSYSPVFTLRQEVSNLCLN